MPSRNTARQRRATLSVYIVEDSPILLPLLKGLLDADPAIQVVGHADTAAAAIAAIRKLTPELVVVDLVLREGNGFEVLEAARASADGGPIAVVLTNHTTPAYREAAARLGVEHFFDKSTDISAMCRLVKELADARRGAAS
jgi:DNA-binding NarL/FixJ family response regulator